jgi:hypothetical protein
MGHEHLIWNPATKEWFCARCGTTSDHTIEDDARLELEQHLCRMPWVEMPETAPDPPEK